MAVFTSAEYLECLGEGRTGAAWMIFTLAKFTLTRIVKFVL